jgi:phage antirepressor YoqD-like protein
VSDLIVREYHGGRIRQRPDGYLSLTDMAQATGRMVNHWRSNASTAAFLQALRGSTGIPVDVLVEVNAGGLNEERGTWGHPQAAHHFALWCSPEFAVRVTAWVEDIRTKGYAVDSGHPPAVDLRDPLQLAAVTAQALQLVAGYAQRLATAEPKADVADRIAGSESERSLQTAAREVFRGRPNLGIRQWLNDGLLFRDSHGKLLPYEPYLREGYFRVIVTESKVDGRAYDQTVVTSKGLVWLAGRYPADAAPISPFRAAVARLESRP